MCDPHQLYQRLESQVQEFVIETKVRQLELLKREKDSPVLPYLFISGKISTRTKSEYSRYSCMPGTWITEYSKLRDECRGNRV